MAVPFSSSSSPPEQSDQPQVTLSEFGPYRAVRLIGQGGMGAVYLGERADGAFSRRVAIQVIHGAGGSSEEIRQRFLVERPALTALQHPNIASLLDCGITPYGEPFLVMEFVDGAPLDLYCDIHRYTIGQRLDLFLEVCAAVDFAHRHLILHRNLKPSNILVDGDGHAKLLDFGAAKLLLGPSAVTQRYASPEQLRGEAPAVSMDVYALSVILYELLTGRWPFGDPNDPSARANVQAEFPYTTREAAEARSISESGLRRAIAGDLQAILAKGLDAELSRRYETVAELAADVARYRSGQPVWARQQTTGYRIRKWIARNPVQTTAAMLAVAGVLTGVVWREQQRWTAEKRFDELRSLARYQMFELQDQMVLYGSPIQVRKRVAERSLQALHTLSSEVSPSFALQADLTEGYIQLAELLGNPLRANLGETEQARGLLARARQMNEVLQAMQGPSRVKDAVQAQLDVQEALFELGSPQQPGGGAERLVRVRKALAAWQAAVDVQALTQAELVRMAMLYHALSEQYGAGDFLKSARRLLDVALAKDRKSPLARFADLQVRVAEAKTAGATDGRQRLLGVVAELDGLPPSESVRVLRARTLGVLGRFEGQAQQYEEALGHLRGAVEGWRQLGTAREELAGALQDLADVSAASGDHALAVQYLEEALRVRNAAELRVRLGLELLQVGRADEGKKAFREGQDQLLQMASAPDAGIRVLSMAARYLVEVPSPDLARATDALVLGPRLESQGAADAGAMEMLTKVYAANGLRTQAEAAYERYAKLVPQGDEKVRNVLGEMQTVLTRLGK
ncbi:hypothetical protein F183_A09730 [Bryobacterales bacterium F-183]|nr:hypothetical protein F183_A09730 [Bryobacterales bacterium F-183]